MRAQEKKSKKYNPAITKLFQIAIGLTDEQQMVLLRHAEGLAASDNRYNLRKTCEITVNYATDCRVYTNNISNISRSGLFIETQKPFVVGDEMIMTFRLDGYDKPLKIKGIIAHATPIGVGVKFKNVSPYIEEMMDIIIRRMN